MSKIDIDKFVVSLMEFCPQQSIKYIKALENQGLEYKDGEIVNIDTINPSEFDRRLNALLKEFESLPQKELASTLEFYLKAVRKETPFDLMRLKEVAKPEVIKPTGVLGELLKTPPTQEELEEAEMELKEITEEEFKEFHMRRAFDIADALNKGEKGTDGELSHSESDQVSDKELSEFEKDLFILQDEYFNSNFAEWKDYVKWKSKKLLDIAKKQLMKKPRFLYAVTRKAAERERKETINEACRWLRRTQPEETLPDTTIDRFKKHMEEQL